MKKYLFIITTITSLLFACKNTDKDSDSCSSNENAETITHNGLNREYVLFVPTSYQGNKSVPLMLNFHGFGDNANSYMSYADMRSVAESDTFILVYPQGSCADGSSHWNPCPTGSDNKSSADDFGFISTLINDLSTQYNIDMERVYATGYSNGGMMAYGLANYKSEMIAAVSSVSGAMLDCTGPTSHPTPILHLHGTNDAVIPYNGNSSYNSVQNTLDHWIDFNNTVTTSTFTPDNTGGSYIQHHVYNQGDSSVNVEHYKYTGGEHVWFTSTFQGKSTSELIWEFCSRYDINGLR